MAAHLPEGGGGGVVVGRLVGGREEAGGDAQSARHTGKGLRTRHATPVT